VKRTPDRPSVGRGKLLAKGRSQTVHLPKEFRLPGKEVLIHREGNRLILEPVDVKGWPIDLWEQLDELAAEFDEDWQRPADLVPPPIRQERDLP
jgi:antitoxin VapB